jgi:hypothetical protein
MENEKKRKLETELQEKIREKRNLVYPFNFIHKCSVKNCSIYKHDNLFFDQNDNLFFIIM